MTPFGRPFNEIEVEEMSRSVEAVRGKQATGNSVFGKNCNEEASKFVLHIERGHFSSSLMVWSGVPYWGAGVKTIAVVYIKIQSSETLWNLYLIPCSIIDTRYCKRYHASL